MALNASYTNINAAITPKGNGANTAQIPDGTAAGGNGRGEYATDWQKDRNANTQVASGNYSTIGGGRQNTASGIESTIGGGFDNTVSGEESTIGGGDRNNISTNNSVIGGGELNSISTCLLYTSPSPRDRQKSRMPSSA